MVTALLAKAAVSIVSSLITSTFMSKLMVEACRAWAGKTANPYDDRVVAAMADALGVEPASRKEAA